MQAWATEKNADWDWELGAEQPKPLAWPFSGGMDLEGPLTPGNILRHPWKPHLLKDVLNANHRSQKTL